MHVSAHLDVDMVAIESTDQITLMLDLTAPIAENSLNRPGQALEVVLDRSGSMSGEPWQAAKESLLRLIDRLAPQDSFGLVVFDNEAKLVSPIRTMQNHRLPELRQIIREMQIGGNTDISAGLLLGLRELKKASAAGGSTLILISDGHANSGNTDPSFFNDVATRASIENKITVSTIGLGVGYDEVLLESAAKGGGGTHRFAATTDEAIGAIAEEVSHLLEKSAVSTNLRIKPLVSTHGAPVVTLLQRLPMINDGEDFIVQLGDLYAGENRRLVIDLKIPQIPALGLCTVVELTLEYMNLSTKEDLTLTLPVSVNVVPQDVAAGRLPNPIVLAERLVIVAQSEKEQATHEMRSGESAVAISRLKATAEKLRREASVLPVDDERSSESLKIILEEAAEMDRLSEIAAHERPEYSSKRMTESFSSKSRSRKISQFNESKDEEVE